MQINRVSRMSPVPQLLYSTTLQNFEPCVSTTLVVGTVYKHDPAPRPGCNDILAYSIWGIFLPASKLFMSSTVLLFPGTKFRPLPVPNLYLDINVGNAYPCL